jgi:hypothetical protein
MPSLSEKAIAQIHPNHQLTSAKVYQDFFSRQDGFVKKLGPGAKQAPGPLTQT